VYIITNKVNGKQYVGDHSTNDLDDQYMGSGILLKKAYNKYNKKIFNKKILEQFNSKEDAFFAQEKWINEYNTLVPNGYNISPKGGNGISGCHSKETIEKLRTPKSEKTKQKISQTLSGREGPNKGRVFSDDWKSNMSKAQKGLKSGESHPLFGKFHSIETKQKISESKKKIIPSEETRKKMSESHIGRTSPNKGKKLSIEQKNKIRSSMIGKKRGPYKKSHKLT